ncbi:hypothetical protein HUO09_17830 [Vibrio sp. Y2-5]|uniref:hypothetical protein n=1 Tax=Vibrio sp. Y2-5 TaxID=2743977 RepID=UPI0016601D3F|nr:hypothetical protein [Vibrio sp. Y2-5]MBD0788219.1 hypothetical protein [Vibrio sp. Y2-5]
MENPTFTDSHIGGNGILLGLVILLGSIILYVLKIIPLWLCAEDSLAAVILIFCIFKFRKGLFQTMVEKGFPEQTAFESTRIKVLFLKL